MRAGELKWSEKYLIEKTHNKYVFFTLSYGMKICILNIGV